MPTSSILGILTALTGYGLYRGAAKQRKGIRLVVSGIAAWLSVLAGALLTAFQLWLSGTSALRVVVPAMLGVHVLIGIGEALITVAALSFIWKTRPDLMTEEKPKGGYGWIGAGALISLLVVLISPLASAFPDGLQRVATDLGFLASGQGATYQILPNYTLPFLGQTGMSTILAGIIGVVIVAGLAAGVTWILRRTTDTQR